MMEAKKRPQSDIFDKDRREALKKLGAIGIAAATAPAMLTLLQATQASAQSVVDCHPDMGETEFLQCCRDNPNDPDCTQP